MFSTQEKGRDSNGDVGPVEDPDTYMRG
jgi:hypothetical protein